jgi:hypothetical protein
MDEKFLIANSLVPDNEVWVSPKTFENPFSRNIADASKHSHNNRSDEIAWLETVLKDTDVNCNNTRNSYFFIKQKINDRIAQLRAMR